MLQRKGVELSRIALWGCPWHGRVQGGQLQLPNGTTKAWPQPDGTRSVIYPSDRSKWLPQNAGYTYRQKMPGIATIERTQEQLAADQLSGLTWLNEALVSGATANGEPGSYLHGNPVPGWVYAAPDGSRWITDALRVYGVQGDGSLSIPLTMLRFGSFGMAPESYLHSLQITAAQLSDPAWSSAQSATAKVESILPDGSQAIICLYPDEINQYPSSFLLLSLSGTPGIDLSVSLSILRSAEQTAGSTVVDNSATIEWHEHVWAETVSTDDQRNAADCSGYIDTITTYQSTFQPGDNAGFKVIYGTNSVSMTGRIVAVCFNHEGQPVDAILSVVKSCSVSAPLPTMSRSGQQVLRQYNDGSPGACFLNGSAIVEYPLETRSRVSSRDYSTVATIQFGSNTVQLSATESYTQEEHFFDGTGTSTRSVTANIFGWIGDGYWPDQPTSLGGTDAVSEITSYTPQDVAPPSTSIGFAPLVAKEAMISLKRWSNNMFCLSAWTPYTATSPYPEYLWSNSLTPDSVVPGDHESPQAYGSTTPWYTHRPYGSYNPITGEAVIASADPVSWT